MTKFGTVLTSRQAGREAYAAFLPTLANLNQKEEVLVDFRGISTFSPSWADEFLTPLQKKFGDRLMLQESSNPSVSLTLSTLEKINAVKFQRFPSPASRVLPQ